MLQHTDHMHSGGQDAATHGSHALWRARCCNTRFPCTLESKMLQQTDHRHSGCCNKQVIGKCCNIRITGTLCCNTQIAGTLCCNKQVIGTHAATHGLQALWVLQHTDHMHSGGQDAATHGSHALWRARCCNTRITCTLEGKMLQHTVPMHSGEQDAATHGSHALWRVVCLGRFPWAMRYRETVSELQKLCSDHDILR